MDILVANDGKSNFSLMEFFPFLNVLEIIECLNDKEKSRNLVKMYVALQKLRNAFGHPIRINSGYRSIRHNNYVKGSKTSQHLSASACDICAIDYKLFPILLHTIKNLAPFNLFGQVIVYPKRFFVHVALPQGNYLKTGQIMYCDNGKQLELFNFSEYGKDKN